MSNQLLIAGLGSQEIIIILVVILLMFGGKKIPELMRGLGRGVKEFKDAKDNPPPAAAENNEDRKG